MSDAGRCRLSNWFVRLIILQVRGSASSRPIMTFASWSSRWISPRLLALVPNCDNALKTYLHRRSTSESSSWRAAARVICYCAVGCRFQIKQVTQKSVGRPQLLIVSPDDSFLPNKKDKYAFFYLNDCILVNYWHITHQDIKEEGWRWTKRYDWEALIRPATCMISWHGLRTVKLELKQCILCQR